VKLAIATTNSEIQRCFPVMVCLRPHLHEQNFVKRVRRQESAGYRLAYVEEHERIRAVSGFRFSENLASGRFMYVDDLVTREGDRGRGYGKALIEWLIELARTEQCDQFHLDSGVQRFEAHHFYMNRGLSIKSHHFSMILNAE